MIASISKTINTRFEYLKTPKLRTLTQHLPQCVITHEKKPRNGYFVTGAIKKPAARCGMCKRITSEEEHIENNFTYLLTTIERVFIYRTFKKRVFISNNYSDVIRFMLLYMIEQLDV